MYSANKRRNADPDTAQPTASMKSLDRLYQTTQNIGMTSLKEIHSYLAPKLKNLEDSERVNWLNIYKQHMIPSIKKWSVLSANHRTLAILGFVIIGQPIGYFLFELTILNMAYFILLTQEKRILRSLKRCN